MRRMSFALTTEQVKDQSKTVTRRKRWLMLKPGDLVQPVKKCMGLKKGEKQEKIGPPIEIIAVDREPLNLINQDDVIREGFPDLLSEEFIELYIKANGGGLDQMTTRISYRYRNDLNEDSTARAINARLQYELTCERLYDRPFRPSLPPKKGHRMEDFALKFNTTVDKMCEVYLEVERLLAKRKSNGTT